MKIQKFLLTLLVFFFFSQIILAQYGNEWINYNQTYYKIPVAQTGVYRISYAQLNGAGFPTASVNTSKIQIFHRGEEIAITISDGGDGVLNSGDYLEFYGIKNDGTQDAKLYRDPSYQVNPYYNLYSDTTAYFLTYAQDASIGKRMQTYTDTDLFGTPDSFHWQEELLVLNDVFYNGQRYQEGSNNEIFLSEFDKGEGWASSQVGVPIRWNFPVENLYTPEATAYLEANVVAVSNNNHLPVLSIGDSPSSLSQIYSGSIFLFSKETANVSFPSSNINGTGQAVLQLSSGGGFVALAYAKLRYAQTTNMSGASSKYFITTAKGVAGKSFLQINNAPSNAIIYDITDIKNITRLSTIVSGDNLQVTVNNTLAERKLYVFEANTVLSSSLQQVSFQNINPTTSDYLIITHSQLRSPVNGVDAVQEYANYRASDAGGNFSTLIANVDELYNQFNYGEKSPLAIRQFVKYMYENGTPEHLFLVGKGGSLPDRYTTSGGVITGVGALNIRQNPADYALDLVPPAGFPPSDVIYSTGLIPGQPHVPAISTGRLSTLNPQAILNYLEKVKEYELPSGNIWKKNFVHLSGGNNESEQNTLKIYIDILKSLAEADYIKADVLSFSKQTTNAVELINIAEQVNRGVGMITFFGHSTKEITDVEIGFASDEAQGYRNRGLYPFILANGCQLASIFYREATLAEDWVNIGQRGAIGFIAHTGIGFAPPLRRYSTRFYNVSFNDLNFIGKSVGEVIQETIRRYGNPNDEIEITVTQQMLYQGDPAISITAPPQPDYYTETALMQLKSFDGLPITARSDSFQLEVIVYNLGISDDTELNISLRRTFPNGITRDYTSDDTYSPIDRIDTLYFTLYNETDLNPYGLNRFEVVLDYVDIITENSENNNTGILEYFIPGVAATAVLPAEFAIVSEQSLDLTVASGEINIQNREFIIEVDTSYQFNSPFKQTFIIQARSAVTQNIQLLPTDSTTYYWRVNFVDTQNDPNVIWGESSFTYIKDSPEGWAQMQYPQFNKNNVEFININIPSQRFEFEQTTNALEVNSFGIDFPGAFSDYSVIYNQAALHISILTPCPNNALWAVAFRKSNGQPFRIENGRPVCGRQPSFMQYFYNNDIANGELETFIENYINEGDYLLLFTVGKIDFTTWNTSTLEALGLIGANNTGFGPLSTLQDGSPYIIFGQKGGVIGSAQEVVAGSTVAPKAEKIQLKTTLGLQVSEGTMYSTLVGPARQWRSFHPSLLTFLGDNYELDIFGVGLNGQETQIFNNVAPPELSLTAVDANQYPYLRLKLRSTDNTQLTPVQLEKWLVIFDGVPEGMINIDAIGAEEYQISDKQEGETFTLEFAFENLRNIPYLDSLEVEFLLTNNEQVKTETRRIKIKPLGAKESTTFSIDLDTRTWAGENNLRVFVNPRKQAELSYDNNILNVSYNVIQDESNPLLEVTFDGRKILDGDIVSPSPLINIRLKDENPFMQIEDTSGLSIALKAPCSSCDFENLYFSNSDINWSTSEGVTEAQVQLKDLEDGVYTLRVQGLDASANRAGVSPYEVNFEVINESTITNFFPYPNPFSTSTRFVFTLTGAVIPQGIKIQIMTVSGKVVREITQDELGPIHIGNNITEYAWDGRDEFGDVLANGVYLYRVLLQGAEGFGERATSADKAFKEGFGKLYILR